MADSHAFLMLRFLARTPVPFVLIYIIYHRLLPTMSQFACGWMLVKLLQNTIGIVRLSV